MVLVRINFQFLLFYFFHTPFFVFTAIWKNQSLKYSKKTKLYCYPSFSNDDVDFYLLESLKFSEAYDVSIILNHMFKKVVFRKKYTWAKLW